MPLLAKPNPKPEDKGVWEMQAIKINLPVQRSGKRRVEKKNALVMMGRAESHLPKCYARNPRQRPVMHSGPVCQSCPSFSQPPNNFNILSVLCLPHSSLLRIQKQQVILSNECFAALHGSEDSTEQSQAKKKNQSFLGLEVSKKIL